MFPRATASLIASPGSIPPPPGRRNPKPGCGVAARGRSVSGGRPRTEPVLAGEPTWRAGIDGSYRTAWVGSADQTHLPAALRTFLLTLAVVDDLLAITIIALFYTDDLQPIWLLLALLPLAVFTLLVQRRISAWWVLLPLAFATWGFVHAAGVHATVAGVLLGFAVPVRARKVRGKDDDRPGMAEHFEHLWRPISAGVAVPIFALFSAGVVIGGWSGLQSAVTDPIAVGVIAGLVLGKPIGILTATFLTSRLTGRPLQQGLTWPDLAGVALLGGIGFTVSLLIGELSFGANPAADDHVKIAVLTGSVTAAVLAAMLLRMRNRRYRLMCEEQARDRDNDGIPDIYEREEGDPDTDRR